jgi:hypothetical protein
MDRLREAVPVALAVSLHAPDDNLRDRLVPINRKYPLKELMAEWKTAPRAAVVNILMVVGLAPVIGVPLPLFSYGGSSLLASLIALGLLLMCRCGAPRCLFWRHRGELHIPSTRKRTAPARRLLRHGQDADFGEFRLAVHEVPLRGAARSMAGISPRVSSTTCATRPASSTSAPSPNRRCSSSAARANASCAKRAIRRADGRADGLHPAAIEALRWHQAGAHRGDRAGATKFVVRPAPERSASSTTSTRASKFFRPLHRSRRPICFERQDLLAAAGSSTKRGIDLAKSWFYTDSVTDLPLMDSSATRRGEPRPFLFRAWERRHF